MADYYLTTPLKDEDVAKLRVGDMVYLSGVVYTARDAAHKRMAGMRERGEKLPIPLEGCVLFYVGPTPPPPGRALGASTPTSAYRMDPFAPTFHSWGVKATIGKGKRSDAFRKSLQDYNAVYLCGPSGCGAMLGRSVIEAELLAFPELGPEAVRRFVLKDMPLTVFYDSVGGKIFVDPDLKAVGLE